MILIAINPYKIETMSILFIKLLGLLKKIALNSVNNNRAFPSPIVLK